MSKITCMFKRIDWQRGNGMMLISASIVVLSMMFMMMLIEFNGIYVTEAIAQTRADTIADSAASYSVTYDYRLNPREAYEMAALLTAYNSSEEKPIASEVEILSWPNGEGEIIHNKRLKVAVQAESSFYYISPEGSNGYYVEKEAIVEAVGPGDYLLVTN